MHNFNLNNYYRVLVDFLLFCVSFLLVHRWIYVFFYEFNIDFYRKMHVLYLIFYILYMPIDLVNERKKWQRI